MTPLGIATITFNIVVMAMVARFILFPFGAEYLRRRKNKKFLAEMNKGTMDNAAIIRAMKELKR